MQLTAGSVLGNFGVPAQALAHQLLDDNAVTVIASDGHNNGARQPALKQAFDYIVQRYGRERAEQLIVHAPAVIVADQFPMQAVAL